MINMNFSFSSVLIAVLSSNLILILITVMLRKKNFFLSIGYRVLMAGLVISVLRILFPFELPNTKNIYFPKFISYIISRFLTPRFYIFNHWFSIWELFLIVWGIGFLIGVYLSVKQYRQLKKVIALHGKELTGNKEIQENIDKICLQKNACNCFKVYQCPMIKVPMVFGLKNPSILFPEGVELDNQQLYFVLYHEMMHHFNHDLFIQMIVQFLSILYWWNPACRVLKKQIHILLEMRVDEEVINHNPDGTLAYLECLLYLLKNHSKNISLPEHMMGFINDNTILIKRFEMLTDPKVRYKKCLVGTSVIVFSLIIYMSSYLLIFEVDYCSPEVLDRTFEVTAEDSFFIKNDDGTYDLYYNNERIDTVTSLEYYSDDIIIYDGVRE